MAVTIPPETVQVEPVPLTPGVPLILYPLKLQPPPVSICVPPALLTNGSTHCPLLFILVAPPAKLNDPVVMSSDARTPKPELLMLQPLPLILVTITTPKVFVPANVCAPVLTAPAWVAEASGKSPG